MSSDLSYAKANMYKILDNAMFTTISLYSQRFTHFIGFKVQTYFYCLCVVVNKIWPQF
ncbi:hypothetical protein P4S67_18195 [Pseudoalteromonas sp. B137]